MESPTELRYRINSHDGLLFVRELAFGEILARIPSAKSVLTPAETDEVVQLCTSVFLGPIESVTRDDDSIYVRCTVKQ